MKKIVSFYFLILFFFQVHAQQPDRIEPPFWWAGMKNPGLQIMVHGKDIASTSVTLSSYPGLTLGSVSFPENSNYLFLNLKITPDTKSGTFNIRFSKGEKLIYSYPYILKKREQGSALREGFNPSDVIYLIMPDRFANGNPSNDEVKSMKEGLNRKDPYGRHGGDIQGMLDHMDYIKKMGFTALWLTPVLENNQSSSYSSHGPSCFNI